MRRTRTIAATTAGMMLLGSAAFADNLVNDGDADVLGVQSTLDLGDVCPGSESAGEAEHWIAKSSNSTVNDNNFANGAIVDFTVTGTSGAELSAAMDDDPSTVTLPSNWRSLSNGDNPISDKVTSTVTLTAPEDEGPFSGSVTYRAQAPRDGGNTTRTETLNVNANVLAADHEDCAEEEVVYDVQGFYAPVKGLDAVSIKGGSTLPLKFNLFDEDGNSIEDEAAKIDLTFTNCTQTAAATAGDPVATVTASGDRQVRWDAAAGQYIYNYKSAKGSGCKNVAVTHDDADTVNGGGLEISLR